MFRPSLGPAPAGLSLAPAAGHSSRLLEPIALIGIAWLRRNEERFVILSPAHQGGAFLFAQRANLPPLVVTTGGWA
jgi:hypothetical protein